MPGCSHREAGCLWAPPTRRNPRPTAPSWHGVGRRTTRSAAGTACATATAGGSAMYLPPLLEELGLAELTHEARNNRMRAI